MRLRVSLRTEAPLAISLSRATGNALETLRHIPGTVWRGALAAACIEERGLDQPSAAEDPVFSELFLRRVARFEDLRPRGAKPWPLSARRCDAYGDEHPATDLLVASLDPTRLPVECTRDVITGRCGAKLAQPGNGFYEWKDGFPVATKPRTRVTAHTAISNVTLRVRAGQFFSTEIIERDTEFEGEMWVALEPDGEAARWLATERRVVLGRGATRGQGWATLRVKATVDPGRKKTDSGLESQLRRFNEAACLSGRTAFSCTLLSPCFALDDWLHSRAYLATADIEEAAGEGGALKGYELAAWFSRIETISGWNSGAGLPKPDMTAISSGAAFLFTRVTPEAERQTELRRLADVLGKVRSGIGERWEEGFGEIEFCDDFHIRRRE